MRCSILFMIHTTELIISKRILLKFQSFFSIKKETIFYNKKETVCNNKKIFLSGDYGKCTCSQFDKISNRKQQYFF